MHQNLQMFLNEPKPNKCLSNIKALADDCVRKLDKILLLIILIIVLPLYLPYGSTIGMLFTNLKKYYFCIESKKCSLYVQLLT